MSTCRQVHVLATVFSLIDAVLACYRSERLITSSLPIASLCLCLFIELHFYLFRLNHRRGVRQYEVALKGFFNTQTIFVVVCGRAVSFFIILSLFAVPFVCVSCSALETLTFNDRISHEDVTRLRSKTMQHEHFRIFDWFGARISFFRKKTKHSRLSFLNWKHCNRHMEIISLKHFDWFSIGFWLSLQLANYDQRNWLVLER